MRIGKIDMKIERYALAAKLHFMLFAGIALFSVPALGEGGIVLTNDQQRISYALGMDVVRILKMQDFDIDMNAVKAGISDTLAGKPAITVEEKRIAMHEMQRDILAKAVAKKEAAGVIHKKEGAAFLAANRNKPGVLIKEVTAPDGSKAELQYKILHSGPPGPSPQSTDTVTVRYRGTLIDGTPFDIFDDSVKHGDVAIFKMKDVIPGWAAALQMMKPGDKWQLFVPPSLAYADYGPPEIGIYTTLIYQLELVSFSTNAPATVVR